jgi:protein ImuB
MAANQAARREGIFPGQALADARALEPGLAVRDADPAAERGALTELADWCSRYTPIVALSEPEPGGAGGLLLDIAGCAHLFGGEAALLADLGGRLARQGYAARAAAADTAGAAWAFARFAPAPASKTDAPADLILPSGRQRASLAGLPLAALRLPHELVDSLAQLGLRRIGDLYPLPRAPLVRRFGIVLCRRLDQALGSLDEAIAPQRPLAPWRMQLAFAEPVGRAEDIQGGLDRLLAALCRRLAAEERGARRLEFALFRSDGTLARAAIGTSRPVREPAYLARLFREPLEGLDPGHGVDLMTLSALSVEPLGPSQPSLPMLTRSELENEDEMSRLGALVDRLGNRLGFENIRRLAPVESHLPERAQRMVPPLALPRGDARPSAARIGARPPRPLRLFARPQPVDAIAPVPDDPPHLFRWGRRLHRICRAEGPERIAPEWWRKAAGRKGEPSGSGTSGQETSEADALEASLRDYYRVEDETGRRFWLYREGLYRPGQPTRWFLHGLFA